MLILNEPLISVIIHLKYCKPSIFTNLASGRCTAPNSCFFSTPCHINFWSLSMCWKFYKHIQFFAASLVWVQLELQEEGVGDERLGSAFWEYGI